MRALGQNPTNKDVKGILENPSAEGKISTFFTTCSLLLTELQIPVLAHGNIQFWITLTEKDY